MQSHTIAKFKRLFPNVKFMFNKTVTHSIAISDCRLKVQSLESGSNFQFVEFDVTAHQQSLRHSTRSGTALTIRGVQVVRGRKKVENHWSNQISRIRVASKTPLQQKYAFFFNALLFFSARLSLFY